MDCSHSCGFTRIKSLGMQSQVGLLSEMGKQGILLEHRENIFDYIYYYTKYVTQFNATQENSGKTQEISS